MVSYADPQPGDIPPDTLHGISTTTEPFSQSTTTTLRNSRTTARPRAPAPGSGRFSVSLGETAEPLFDTPVVQTTERPSSKRDSRDSTWGMYRPPSARPQTATRELSRPSSRSLYMDEDRPLTTVSLSRSARPRTASRPTTASVAPSQAITLNTLRTAGQRTAYREQLEKEIQQLRDSRGATSTLDKHTVCRDCQLMELRKRVRAAEIAAAEEEKRAEAAAAVLAEAQAKEDAAREALQRKQAAAQVADFNAQIAADNDAQRKALLRSGRYHEIDPQGDVFGSRPGTSSERARQWAADIQRQIVETNEARSKEREMKRQAGAEEAARAAAQAAADEAEENLVAEAKRRAYNRTLQDQQAEMARLGTPATRTGTIRRAAYDSDPFTDSNERELARLAAIRKQAQDAAAEQLAEAQKRRDELEQAKREEDEATRAAILEQQERARQLNRAQIAARRAAAQAVDQDRMDQIAQRKADEANRPVTRPEEAVLDFTTPEYPHDETCQCEICKRILKKTLFSEVDSVAFGILRREAIRVGRYRE